MCDAFSMASAGSDLAGGFIGAKDARSVANFNAEMIEVQRVLSSADTSAKKGQMNREFSQLARRNMAAMAVSGLSSKSFAAVKKGNREELALGMDALETTQRAREIGMTAQKAMTLAEGRMQAATQMFSGISQASFTMMRAEQAYQKSNTNSEKKPQTRFDYFKESIR